MYQVVPEQVSQLKRFFAEPPPANAAMLQAFFEGRAIGRAYVNDFRTPTACVVAMNYRFVFFGGEVTAHFYEHALRELRRDQSLHLVCPVGGFKGLKRPSPDADVRRFEFGKRHDPERIKVRGLQRRAGELGEVKRIDAILFNRCMWRDEVIRVVGSAEEFLMHGIGYCLMVEGRIASEAYGCLWTPKRVELACVTHEDFRGRGFAAVTCAHLIDTCEAVGFETYWSCDVDNGPSVHLASRLGYDEPREYRMLRFEKSAAPSAVLV